MEFERDWTRERLEKDYIKKMKAVTISTDITIDGKQRILNQGEMEQILRSARRIAQQECDCRKEFGHCIEPMNGCLSIDDEADRVIENNAKEITVEDALKSLETTHEAGFVHMAYIFHEDDKLHYICSCCTCCCHSLAAAVRFGYSDHVIHSKMIAQQNEDNCTNCGTCTNRCQFNARSLENDQLRFETDKCAGCGLCVKTCEFDAIEMTKRPQSDQ
jgi:Pyruvate/2-oxoacid:ferredoxin oxidoreductase delta subunit